MFVGLCVTSISKECYHIWTSLSFGTVYEEGCIIFKHIQCTQYDKKAVILFSLITNYMQEKFNV